MIWSWTVIACDAIVLVVVWAYIARSLRKLSEQRKKAQVAPPTDDYYERVLARVQILLENEARKESPKEESIWD